MLGNSHKISMKTLKPGLNTQQAKKKKTKKKPQTTAQNWFNEGNISIATEQTANIKSPPP